MLVKLKSSALHGLEGLMVEVEVDSIKGLPGQSIVGLPDAAVKESRDRVKFAITNSGFEFPPGYFTINLAPGDIRKEGPLYDLPIAIGMLASSGQLPHSALQNAVFIGELSLDGEVRPVNGVLPICLAARTAGAERAIVSIDNADEAALVSGLMVIPVKDLRSAGEYLKGERSIDPHKIDIASLFDRSDDFPLDFSDVKGQQHAKRALMIAAAGSHNILMIGPPGSGKTMLANRIPGILPPLSIEEALDVTKLYSITGLLGKKSALITRRPFRSPHHTTSDIGIIGGGRMPRPGEVSLAHHGILFLDEFPEFEREVLEVLRQPLEDGKVTISRALASFTYPAEFMLVAAMNPCPCGNYMDPVKSCLCPPYKLQKYWGKLSRPLLDRIDIQIEVPRLKREELSSKPLSEPSSSIKEKVVAAREAQKKRLSGSGLHSNSRMTPKMMREFCKLGSDAEEILKSAILHLKLSGRSYDRILKVSRTIADLDRSDMIKAQHIAEAAQYRSIDAKGGEFFV